MCSLESCIYYVDELYHGNMRNSHGLDSAVLVKKQKSGAAMPTFHTRNAHAAPM